MTRISLVLVVIAGKLASADPRPQDPYPDVRIPRRPAPARPTTADVPPDLWSDGPMRYSTATGEVDRGGGVALPAAPARPTPPIVAALRNATAASHPAPVTRATPSTATAARPAVRAIDDGSHS